MLYFERHDCADGESSETIALLHGGFSSAEQWRSWLPLLNDEYNVLLIDSPGHGRSRMIDGPLSYARMTAEIVRLLDQLDLRRAHFVGHSDGGVIALHLLNDFEERVETATLIGTPFHLRNYRDMSALDAVFSDLENRSGEIYEVLFDSVYKPVEPDPNAFPDLVTKLKRTWLSEPFFSDRQLASMTRPVLVVSAGQDEFLPAAVFEETAALISRARLLSIPDGDHNVPMTHADAVVSGLRRFLESTA